MTKRSHRNARKDKPFDSNFHRPFQEQPMPTRHALDKEPSDPGADLSWLLVFLGCAALALVIAYPVILTWLVGLGVVSAVVAVMDS